MNGGVTFEQLVAEHQDEVLRVCRSIVRDEHLGADAAQETFMRLWRALGTDRAPRRPGAWIQRVAVTISLDQLRASRRRDDAEPHQAQPHQSQAGEVQHSIRAPADELAAQELDEHFERALTTLSEGQRTVFLLRHQGGLSLARVAETLDLALPTVKTQFARACLRLQSALRAFAPEDRS